MKSKKKNHPKWQQRALELSRYLFFFLYLVVLAGSVYGIWRLRQPKPEPKPLASAETPAIDSQNPLSPELSAPLGLIENQETGNAEEDIDVKKS